MKMKSVRCPNCGAIRFKPDGMCCNSGKDSGCPILLQKMWIGK
jgi:uncharacterized OB-fold protein